MKKETWKAIPNYEGYYEVSDLGRVRSLDRFITYSDGRVTKHKGKVLTQNKNKRGRLYVSLKKNAQRRNYQIHILVTLSFIGPKPEGYEACHLDGDILNNKLSNLRYDTRSENRIDVYRQGNKSGVGKLFIEQVLEIRKLYATGKYKQTELAEMFGIAQINISRVVRRETFTWLNDDGTIQESKTEIKYAG